MTVHNTGRYSVALYLQPEELETGSNIDDEWARKLALSVLDDMGVPLDGTLEIEAFTGHGGLMVFAALHPESEWETVFISFADLDGAIDYSAAVMARPPQRSNLFQMDGQYILAMSAPPDGLTPIVLMAGEFGRRLLRPAAYLRFLREHGQTVLDGCAVQALACIGERV